VTAITVDAHEPEQFGEFALWVVAALIVVALHLGLGVAYLWLKPEPDRRAEAPAFDVAFMPAVNAPAAAPSVDQPDPAPIMMDEPKDPAKDPPPPPVPVQPPPETPTVEAMVTPEPPPAPPVTVQPAPPPPPAASERTAAIPPPTEVVPVPEKTVTVPEQAHRKIAPSEKVEKRQLPPKSVASPGTKPMRVASAPNPGAENEGARVGLQSWISEAAAHLRRFSTYASNGSTESGTVQVSVTFARNGHVLSRRVAGSSGSARLDQAALAVIDRAQPFPPFPASMAEAQVTRTVPLHLRPQ
jgi:periplasmic protein TonB